MWTSVLRHHCAPTEKTPAAASTLIFHPKLQLPDWEFIFLNIVFQQEKLLWNGGGDQRVDGLIPLMQRHRLKSFLSHEQTSCRLKLPPPTYPAATLQLFWNQSKIKSAALFMHQTKRFLSDIPGMCDLKKKINVLCCYLKSNACRLLSDSSVHARIWMWVNVVEMRGMLMKEVIILALWSQIKIYCHE